MTLHNVNGNDEILVHDNDGITEHDDDDETTAWK